MSKKIFIRCPSCHTLKGCDMNNQAKACDERGCKVEQKHKCVRELREKIHRIVTAFPCAICGYKQMKRINSFASDE